MNDVRFSITLKILLMISWRDDRIVEKVDDIGKDKNVSHAIIINRKILSHLWKPHLGIMSLKTMDVEKGVLEENRGELSIKTGSMSNVK